MTFAFAVVKSLKSVPQLLRGEEGCGLDSAQGGEFMHVLFVVLSDCLLPPRPVEVSKHHLPACSHPPLSDDHLDDEQQLIAVDAATYHHQ